MKRHALFVGVNHYDDKAFKKLQYSISDAVALSGAFAKRGFDVEVLDNPKAEVVLGAVERKTSDLGSGDVFLFFFAGHGFTAPDGSHLLICSNDRLAYLRHNRAGIPVDLLEEITNGRGCNRAFLLDACRTDVFAGVENRGAETRDLALVSLPDAKVHAGTCSVLRSCDRFCPAMEFDDIGHGVFTRAVMDVLCDDSFCVTPFGEAFVAGIRSRMHMMLSAHSAVGNQNPCFQTNGEAFYLFDVIASNRDSQPPPTAAYVSAPKLVVCPVCGKKNRPEDTFKCRECDRDNLCLRHQDEKTFLCADCTAKKARKEAERQASNVAMNTRCAIEESNNGNYGKAYEFAQKADLNNAAIQGIIGYALVNGIGCKKDVQRGIAWWLKAAMQGSAPFQHNLGVLYFEGKDVSQNDLEAVKWFKKAAENGYAPAQASLANCYECARGVPKSESEAIVWCRKAAENGFVPAQYNMGVLYYNGCNAITKDEAQKWLKMATAKGNDEATKLLDLIEERSISPQPQSVSAKEFYEKGKNYYYGRNGLTQSFVDAVECFRSAAELGHAWAQCYLGTCYMHGEGVSRDEKKAVKWYRRAADAGNGAAQCFIANCYIRGQGVCKNDEEAVKWYRKAANEGNVTAQCNLGNCYYLGKGVALDYIEAVEWYRRAAAKENAIAQNCLGLCYEKGQGVAQDYSEAANLYRKAIANGNERAKESLERVEQKIAASLKTKTIRIPRDLVPTTSASGYCDEIKSAVVLDDCGSNKIAVIQEIRAIKGMGLAEAKELVESSPVAIIRDVAMSECRRIAQRLEKAGARVHYTVASSPTRTLGNILRDARLAKGYYSIEQLAAKAKIPTEFARDLENDDFHCIATPIYGHGFVKLYAECVGLDPAPLVEMFMAEYNAQKF